MPGSSGWRTTTSSNKASAVSAFYGIPPHPGSRWAQEREHAFQAIVDEESVEGMVYQGSPTSAGGWGMAVEELVTWLAELPKPIGIIAVTDARARQLLQACVIGGFAVPEQIAIVGIDNDPMAQLLTRIPLTSVIQGAEEMGRTAAHLLHQMPRRHGLFGHARAGAATSASTRGISRASTSRCAARM